MKPKLLLLSPALIACISSSAAATIQELDSLRWGEHKYCIYIPNTRAYDAVIVFDIDKGQVKSMNSFPAARPKATWNGR